MTRCLYSCSTQKGAHLLAASVTSSHSVARVLGNIRLSSIAGSDHALTNDRKLCLFRSGGVFGTHTTSAGWRELSHYARKACDACADGLLWSLPFGSRLT
jgi:hypothetical protein